MAIFIGVVKSADIITLEQAKQLVEASQRGKNLKIEWNEDEYLQNISNLKLIVLIVKLKTAKFL